MVAISGFENSADRIIEGINPSCPIIKRAGHGTMMPPMIGPSHLNAKVLVSCAHEFAPSDDLADKPLDRVQGNGLALSVGQGRINNLLRCQKADI